MENQTQPQLEAALSSDEQCANVEMSSEANKETAPTECDVVDEKFAENVEHKIDDKETQAVSKEEVCTVTANNENKIQTAATCGIVLATDISDNNVAMEVVSIIDAATLEVTDTATEPEKQITTAVIDDESMRELPVSESVNETNAITDTASEPEKERLLPRAEVDGKICQETPAMTTVVESTASTGIAPEPKKQLNESDDKIVQKTTSTTSMDVVASPIAATEPEKQEAEAENQTKQELLSTTAVENSTLMETAAANIDVESTVKEVHEATNALMDVDQPDPETDIAQAQISEQVVPNPPTQSAGLSLLAQYDTDDEDADAKSDADSVVEVPVTTNANEYRKKVIEVDSDSDTTSDSDSEGEYLTELRKEIDKRIQTVDDDEEDDDDDDDADEQGNGNKTRSRRKPPRVKGEMLLEDLPPIQDLQITVPEEECIELGRVQSIVDQLVLVSVLPNSMLYDLETVLFLEKGHKVLGKVFDVLGQVADPIYCVRFNTNEQIKERNINIGDIVYCAPTTEHTQFVILSKLTQIRGSDASWENDIEPPPRYLDYSDDEQEREARYERRNKNRNNQRNENNHYDSSKRTRNDGNVDESDAASTSSEATQTRPYQRGRRGMRESMNGNGSYRSHSRDQQHNYHPSYNSGSWHSNYYHNYAPMANFNMPPPPPHQAMHMGYGMPYPAYGMPPAPYGMLPPRGYPPHVYPQPHYAGAPQQSPYAGAPPQQQPPPPPSPGNAE